MGSNGGHHRATTPKYKSQSKQRPQNFDPFEPDYDEAPQHQPQQPAVWGRYDLNGPPPPPPPGPPPENRRRISSNTRGNGNAISPTNGYHRMSGNEAQTPQAQGSNPFSPTKHFADRKRRYYNSSDEDDNAGARRQIDDVIQKQKKNQPKVADAYRQVSCNLSVRRFLPNNLMRAVVAGKIVVLHVRGLELSFVMSPLPRSQSLHPKRGAITSAFLLTCNTVGIWLRYPTLSVSRLFKRFGFCPCSRLGKARV